MKRKVARTVGEVVASHSGSLVWVDDTCVLTINEVTLMVDVRSARGKVAVDWLDETPPTKVSWCWLGQMLDEWARGRSRGWLALFANAAR